jgi:hypothetical protein
VGAIDAVETARRAGRLLGLLPALIDGWVRERQGWPAERDATLVEAAELAVARLQAAVEGEIDRLYLLAFAAARARLSVGTSRPRPARAIGEGYAAAAREIARELKIGWWGQHARHLRRLAADLRRSVELIRRQGGAVRDWTELAHRWARVETYPLPPEPPRRSVFHDGDRVVVHTGSGDDRVLVESHRVTGAWRVVVNGEELRFPAGTAVVVRAGSGDDHITVAGSVGVTVLGGDGDDVLWGGDGHDRLYGGPGDDYLDGGDGDDLLSGGAGNDVVYGLGGDDLIDGGEGRDYLDGGDGADLVDGGPGGDVVSGGPGDDVLRGGSGDDRLYAGAGTDLVDGGPGTDVAYLTPASRYTNVDVVHSVDAGEVDTWIKVRGTPRFVERVRADLRLLRASPVGQRMLAELDRLREASRPTEDTLLIVEDDASSATWTAIDRPDGSSFSVFTVAYDTARGVSADRSPPVIGLFHELAHVYDFANRTSASGVHDDPDDPSPNDERTAVGLPIDHDGDPATPHRIDPNHPYELSENALRDEMGLARRERYGRGASEWNHD